MSTPELIHHEACKNPNHNQHLCFLMCDGFHYSHPAEYKAMVQNAEYRCQNCSRTAKEAAHLCEPIKL
jgi:hypothetical protein